MQEEKRHAGDNNIPCMCMCMGDTLPAGFLVIASIMPALPSQHTYIHTYRVILGIIFSHRRDQFMVLEFIYNIHYYVSPRDAQGRAAEAVTLRRT